VAQPYRVLMIATSYPLSEDDWQGLFIRKIADVMSDSDVVELALWAPDGPRHEQVDYACNASDEAWLAKLAGRGGIAHLLRTKPLTGVGLAGGLLKRLRALYRQRLAQTDIFHINWLQNALPLYGMRAKAVITILGTDFKLLKLPGMVTALRGVMKTNECILAPNASWMRQSLEDWFGDVATISPVNFGIDERWYELECAPPQAVNHWLCVLRVTSDKIGELFRWGEDVFNEYNQLHLIGPNQDGLDIPSWVNFHGPVPAVDLVSSWYPDSIAYITLSQHSEGRPQVLLETMAAGMPVIASNIPAHAETIVSGEHGYLVDSAIEFRCAIEQLSDPAVHRQMSGNCRKTSREQYGLWSDCRGRYLQLYGQLT
jgi:hypothetical protein